MSSQLPPEIAECAGAALDRKAEDLVVLDLRGISDVTDYFIISHGTSDRQVLAIADRVEERLRQTLGLKPASVEGRRRADWILLDYIDFVVHVFVAERREFYRLERLWGDAPSLDLSDLEPRAAGQSPGR